MNVETALELAVIFMCEEHDFSHLRGFSATEQLFLVFCLMYINLEEILKENRAGKKRKKKWSSIKKAIPKMFIEIKLIDMS